MNHPFDRLNVFQLEFDDIIFDPSTASPSNCDLLLLADPMSTEFEMMPIVEVIRRDRCSLQHVRTDREIDDRFEIWGFPFLLLALR